jgi:hypothetical protein
MREREVVGLPFGNFGKGRKIKFWYCNHNTKKPPRSCQKRTQQKQRRAGAKTALKSLLFSSTSPKYQVSLAQGALDSF